MRTFLEFSHTDGPPLNTEGGIQTLIRKSYIFRDLSIGYTYNPVKSKCFITSKASIFPQADSPSLVSYYLRDK